MNSRSCSWSFGWVPGRRLARGLLRAACLGAALHAAACSGGSSSSPGGEGGGPGGDLGTGGDDIGGIDPGIGGGDSTASGLPGAGERCDGVDNDGNGIIDDVDAGQDGVCDCIRIATLGEPGEWGQGDVFDAWLDERSTNGAVDLNDAELTPEELSKHQVIIIQDVSGIGRSYSPSEVEALAAWIEDGGGLMTLIGYGDPDERENVNTLLEPLGVGYDREQILARGQGGSTIPITEWSGSHPVLAGIERVGVDNGYPVIGEGTTLATGDGHDVLKALESGKGRVLVWGDEWITYNSEWVDHPDYQVERFWLNAIKWMTPANECQVAIPPDIN
ncbi:hypothetical protein [Sorangium sp. So ce131]|uniref:hypothetical protein n=1 Tax=Sorangium sp. So ce131 TaxID=3133282 RepID=UPI003F5FD7F1